jgi:TonB family protein
MNQPVGAGELARRQAFRRLLWLSSGVHVAAFAFFAFAPGIFRSDAPAAVSVVTVNLLAAPGPPPRPRPAAPAPPAPPEPKKVILPTEPTTPKPKKEAKPKPQAKPEPKPEPPKETPKPPQEIDYEDALAQLRDEAGEAAPETPPPPDEQPSGTGGGGGEVVSPEVAAFIRDAKAHVTRNWILEPGFRGQRLRTTISVLLAADGEVLGTEVVERSGNPWFDESAERAVAKASPLPRPPDAGEWLIQFTPGDVL